MSKVRIIYRRIQQAILRVYRSLVFTSVEAFIAFLAIAVGIPVLINPDGLSPQSLQSQMPLWLVIIWAVAYVVGGGLTLLGIITSVLRIERAGVVILATMTAIYAFAIFAFVGSRGYASIITVGAFSLAMYARYWVLGIVIKSIKSTLKIYRENK